MRQYISLVYYILISAAIILATIVSILVDVPEAPNSLREDWGVPVSNELFWWFFKIVVWLTVFGAIWIPLLIFLIRNRIPVRKEYKYHIRDVEDAIRSGKKIQPIEDQEKASLWFDELNGLACYLPEEFQNKLFKRIDKAKRRKPYYRGVRMLLRSLRSMASRMKSRNPEAVPEYQIDQKQIQECELLIERTINTRNQSHIWREDVLSHLLSHGHKRVRSHFDEVTKELENETGSVASPFKRGKEVLRVHIRENLKTPKQ